MLRYVIPLSNPFARALSASATVPPLAVTNVGIEAAGQGQIQGRHKGSRSNSGGKPTKEGTVVATPTFPGGSCSNGYGRRSYRLPGRKRQHQPLANELLDHTSPWRCLSRGDPVTGFSLAPEIEPVNVIGEAWTKLDAKPTKATTESNLLMFDLRGERKICCRIMDAGSDTSLRCH